MTRKNFLKRIVCKKIKLLRMRRMSSYLTQTNMFCCWRKWKPESWEKGGFWGGSKNMKKGSKKGQKLPTNQRLNNSKIGKLFYYLNGHFGTFFVTTRGQKVPFFRVFWPPPIPPPIPKNLKMTLFAFSPKMKLFHVSSSGFRTLHYNHQHNSFVRHQTHT